MKELGSVSHQKVYLEIKNSILNNQLKVGDWLQSENELCEKYAITRPTVRISLSRLEHEGYIERIQGKGSKVTATKSGLGILSASGTTDGVHTSSKLNTRIVALIKLEKWSNKFPFDIAYYTQNKINCYCLKRERKIDEKIVIYEETYLPNMNLVGFENINFENKSLFKTLSENYDIKIKGGNQRFKSKSASKTDAETLKINYRSPILYIEREIFTNKPDFKLYSLLSCNTENYFIEGSF